MNIALLTFYSPHYQKVADLVIPNRDAYCKKHGYEHVVIVGPYKNSDNYYAFDRIACVKDMLFWIHSFPAKWGLKHFDAVWVLNVHAMIMNFNFKIEDFMDDQHSFFIAKNHAGMNAGSYIVKNTNDGIKYLDFILAQESTHKKHEWYEQKIMMDNEHNDDLRGIVKILPSPSINGHKYAYWNMPDTTLGNWKRGDFVLHMPGTTREFREEFFASKEVLDQIIY